jgi:serine/threonine-protein kinase
MLAAGDQVAGYQLGEQIGTGGMAVVYRALDLRLDRQVALKVLAPRLAEDDAFRQRFIRESRAAAGVDHPYIIPVFEAGEAGGVLFIAMRYVSSGDVRSLIQSAGRLSLARTTAIASQAASALDAAHAHGLIHRDVKPGNILIDGSGGRDHVYLADFGLSKYSLAANTLTSTGQFMGTLDYVSPEQIQGQPADGRADQYALACTVVEMLSGRPPYKRDESMALLWAQLEAPPPILTELRPDLPAEVNEVMQTALAKSPADRYPTCLAFAAALSAAGEASRPVRPALREPTHLAAPVPPLLTTPPAAARTAAGQTRPQPVPAQRPQGYRPAPARPPTPGSSPRSGTGAPGNRPVPAGPPAAGGRPQRDYYGARDPHLVPARPRRRRGRAALITGIVAVVAIGGAAGAAVALKDYRDHHPRPRPTTTITVTPAVTLSPADTVRAYFAAINARDYQRAWSLSEARQTETYQQFVAGYAGTKLDTVTIAGTSGNVVTASLVATQTDGTVKTFQGTYTVLKGVIVKSHVLQVSGPTS